MHHESHYNTVTHALEQLRKKGFEQNIYIQDKKILCNGNELKADDLEIVEVYRYEGATDPADQATVYAVESKSGIKGAIVDGYGKSADVDSAELIKSIPIRKGSL